jgi:hypothetical protein
MSGTITISGWALDLNTVAGTPISSVTVALPGTQPMQATYGISRPDVCTTYPGRAGCPNVGFSYAMDTSNLSGPQTITVTATDSSSPPNVTSSNISINVTSGGLFNLEAPANGSTLSGIATISGWAIAPAGSLINSVKVYVDGMQLGLAKYGVARTDICGMYPTGVGCPNVGFTYSLNTTLLGNGSHTISVSAIIEDGAPPAGTGSATVTVAN